jgi:chromosome segregation ATPase
MPSQDNEPLQNIPRIVPDRDDVASYQRTKQSSRPKPAERGDDAGVPADGGSGGPRSRSRALYAFAIATLLLLGWAGYLQLQLAQAQDTLISYQTRLEDLERRLSVTDESVSQSSVAMGVKITELDAEIRKIWDNVWKKTKETMDQHSAQLAGLDKSVKGSQASVTKLEQGLSGQKTTLDGMREQLEKAAKTEATVELSKRKLEEQQVALEAVTEKINRLSSEQGKLTQRITTNEEWVQSINNFRKQTNREIVNIKQQLGTPVSEQ